MAKSKEKNFVMKNDELKREENSEPEFSSHARSMPSQMLHAAQAHSMTGLHSAAAAQAAERGTKPPGSAHLYSNNRVNKIQLKFANILF